MVDGSAGAMAGMSAGAMARPVAGESLLGGGAMAGGRWAAALAGSGGFLFALSSPMFAPPLKSASHR